MTLKVARRVFVRIALLASTFACAPLFAQDFPNKPIRMISPFPAGNVNEIVMRIVGDRFKEVTGQPFVYEYKAGGAGVIAAQTLMASAPDGYTILLCTSGMTSINPHAFEFLYRDVTNVGAWFARHGEPLEVEELYAELVAIAGTY